ncbi:MAG TPA: hypothetical protein VI758_06060 [Bacteroidota bacterium]
MNQRYRRSLNTVACCVILLQSIAAQTNIVSTKISLADWGLGSPTEIRFGVLATIFGKDKQRLKVNLLLNKEPGQWTGALVVTNEPQSFPDTMRRRSFSRATWVWNTDELLKDSSKTRAMLSDVVGAQFDKIFLQLPYNFEEDTTNDDGLRTLVTKLRFTGASVSALSGDPQYCLPKNHGKVIRLVQKVIEYNKLAVEEARFAGVHLDIEPYLLPGFGGPRRKEILTQFLTITKLAAQAAHENGLRFGTDIPFWYGLPDEFTGKIDSVAFDGSTKPANEHVTDLADEICTMSYRTAAGGLNGIVALTEHELIYAASRGKEVLVGLETGDVPDEQHEYFQGIPTSDPAMLGNSDRVICMVRDHDSVGVSCLERSQLDSLIAASHGDRAHVSLWEVRNSSFISSANLSFAKAGRHRLDETIRVLVNTLAGYASFGGVAIHHEASYATMRE